MVTGNAIFYTLRRPIVAAIFSFFVLGVGVGGGDEDEYL